MVVEPLLTNVLRGAVKPFFDDFISQKCSFNRFGVLKIQHLLVFGPNHGVSGFAPSSKKFSRGFGWWQW